jgi:hypothetical protein
LVSIGKVESFLDKERSTTEATLEDLLGTSLRRKGAA